MKLNKKLLHEVYTHVLLFFFLIVLVGCAGKPGKDGLAGQPGHPGEGCTVEQMFNGAMIKCGDFSAIVLNGEDGTPTSFTIVEVIDPCGDKPGYLDEIIFRLANGSLIAHFTSAGLQGLTVLTPGNYRTLDKQACNFTVTPTNEVIW